jgi:hypothetical protein
MVFAHLPEKEKEVEATARVFDEDMVKRAIKSLDKRIERGSKLTFELKMDGANIENRLESLVWQGESTSVEFIVGIPAEYQKTNVFGKLFVSEDNVPIGHITFMLKVGVTGKAAVTENLAETQAKKYKYAFISYASEDRKEVLKRTQVLSRVGLNFFQDLLSLEPGDRWAKKLYKEIDKSDVFFLFWSGAAKESEWVTKEWEYALELKQDTDEKPPEIIPVIIEGPPPAEPPGKLEHLHFNDLNLYYMLGS